MYDLILTYLIMIISLFGVNIGFFLTLNKLNNKKMIISSIAICVFIFIISLVGIFSYNHLIFLNDYLDVIFLIDAIILILMSILFLLNYKKEIFLNYFFIIVIFSLIATIFILNSQIRNFNIIDSLLTIILLLIVIFLSFNIFKLLIYAKRPLSILNAEYIILESIFLFLCALTYESVKNLDYGMFNPFLILTPTYQLIYLLIGICGLLFLGLYLNDRKMKRKFN